MIMTLFILYKKQVAIINKKRIEKILKKKFNLYHPLNIVTKIDIWFGGNRLDFHMGHSTYQK